MDQSPLIQSSNSAALSSSSNGVAPVTNSVISNHDTNVSEREALPNQAKILVVDDEADAAILFAELLNTTGKYIVQTAADGQECLSKCQNMKFDLVLLDIVMPKLDGVETLRQIKEDSQKYGDPKVIMLTNIGGDIAIEKALELGAIGFKLKIATEPEELLKTVEDALNGVPIKNSSDDIVI